MQPTEVSAPQAAELLGVTERQLKRLERNYHLRPSKTRPKAFLLDDVLALKEVRDNPPTYAQLAVMAKQADMRARGLERAVRQLLHVLHADVPLQDLSEEAVKALHLRMQEALQNPLQPTTEELHEWGRTFFGIGEEVLEAIELHVHDGEPWWLPLALSKRFLSEAPRDLVEKDPETRAAYQYLTMAQRTMREASYFYVRHKHGSRSASELFPHSTGQVHKELSALASAVFS